MIEIYENGKKYEVDERVISKPREDPFPYPEFLIRKSRRHSHEDL